MAGGGIFLATNLRRIPAKAAAALPPFGGEGTAQATAITRACPRWPPLSPPPTDAKKKRRDTKRKSLTPPRLSGCHKH
jgi:hypothetical protein